MTFAIVCILLLVLGTAVLLLKENKTVSSTKTWVEVKKNLQSNPEPSGLLKKEVPELTDTIKLYEKALEKQLLLENETPKKTRKARTNKKSK